MTIKKYIVYCTSRNYPQYGVREVILNAPTKKWIRENWTYIMGNNEFVIKDIVLCY